MPLKAVPLEYCVASYRRHRLVLVEYIITAHSTVLIHVCLQLSSSMSLYVSETIYELS